MIGLAFLGTIVVSAERMQLSIDLLGQFESPRFKAFLGLCQSAVTILICGFVTYQSWGVLVRIFRMGQKSGSAGIPMWIPHASITICFGALTLIGLLTLFRQVTTFGRRRPLS